MVRLREHATPAMKGCFAGVVQTVWSGAGAFLNEYHATQKGNATQKTENTPSKCFIQLYDEIANLRSNLMRQQTASRQR
jgi:hypothetical protein